MTDADSMVVTYRDYRGEPRAPFRKHDSWEGRGDCVDCNACVVVCPMGIDIRDGSQLECINCALCIDACNDIMDRIGRPRGLIAYDTLANVDRRAEGKDAKFKLLRARPLIYVALIALVGALMTFGLSTRSTLDLNVLRDRNPLFVTLSDGSVRNGYTLKIINKEHSERRFSLKIEGLEIYRINVVGRDVEGIPLLKVKPDRLASFRVFIAAPLDVLEAESTPIAFHLMDSTSSAEVSYDAVFLGPER